MNSIMKHYEQAIKSLEQVKAPVYLNDKWARNPKRHTSWKAQVKTDKPWGNRLDKREDVCLTMI
jgi:hypothetical protein